ncbi:MAG: PAS domain-containing protein [Anaerolineales bacterium]|nr:PAS domain-containing protein [Anaerolineales bacterium]
MSDIRSSTFLSRIFRPDPHRDLFITLAESLDTAVLVTDASNGDIITCNHPFLILSSYSRPELAEVTLVDLIHDQMILDQLHATAPNQTIELKSIPFIIRDGSAVDTDIQAAFVQTEPPCLLLQIAPTQKRVNQESLIDSQGEKFSSLSAISSVLLEDSIQALPSALNLSLKVLGAEYAGIYRISATSPDYSLSGLLPPAFPSSLPLKAITVLTRTTEWKLGMRPEHELHRAARTAGLGYLRTALIGDENAWIGMLVIGWEQQDSQPPFTPALMDIIANLCHAAILFSLQRTSLAELQTQLSHYEAELTQQFHAVSEALITLDADYQIMEANSAALEMLGYPEDDLLHLLIQDVLVGPEDVLTTVLDAAGHQRSSERSHLILHRRDGTPFPVHLRVEPFSHTARSRLLIILNDLSEKQAIENQTETLAQRALLGEVSAIFAHEVRNPINNISTGIQLIASRLGKDDKLAPSLERIRNECTRLDRLMTDVLFFSRPLEVKIEPVDLPELIDRIIGRWMPRLKMAGIHCHCNFPDDCPFVLADPRTFEQVVVNLVSNGVQAMEKGGTLSFAISPVQTPQGMMVELRIADTGPGIPKEVAERIFDPFFTTKKDGTGLGLAISRRIIASHRGNIRVESYPGAGTVFLTQLPAAPSNKDHP